MKKQDTSNSLKGQTNMPNQAMIQYILTVSDNAKEAELGYGFQDILNGEISDLTNAVLENNGKAATDLLAAEPNRTVYYLHLACAAGSLDCLKQIRAFAAAYSKKPLVKDRCGLSDSHLPSNKNNTALRYAVTAYNHKEEIVRYLESLGCEPPEELGLYETLVPGYQVPEAAIAALLKKQ